MNILQQYRFNISLPHRLQSQQPILETFGKWWHSLTGFNMRDYPHVHESILFGFPGNSNDAIAINYCILYAKHFIYRAKLNNQNILTIDFLSYLSHLKYILKIENNICIAKN